MRSSFSHVAVERFLKPKAKGGWAIECEVRKQRSRAVSQPSTSRGPAPLTLKLLRKGLHGHKSRSSSGRTEERASYDGTSSVPFDERENGLSSRSLRKKGDGWI